MKTKKNYLPLIITGILFLIIYFIGINIPSETIKNIVENAGIFGPVVLIFLIWITNVFAPLGAVPFFFAGFYLYGETIIIYATIAAILATISNFWIAKIWGRKLVIKLLGIENLEKIDKLTDNYGYQTLFIIRIFLGSFHDIISYIFGLTKIKFIPYFIISFIGMIPGTLLWYYLSSKIQNPLIFTILTFGIAYLLLSLYILGLKIFKKEKQFSKPNR
ncbi:MAG: VTT domain-containing protein [Candidatus Daviesbacteria bacterium]|nr:VTT domain-containing protein [Candidatus Daviesbacteria bacterium]